MQIGPPPLTTTFWFLGTRMYKPFLGVDQLLGSRSTTLLWVLETITFQWFRSGNSKVWMPELVTTRLCLISVGPSAGVYHYMLWSSPLYLGSSVYSKILLLLIRILGLNPYQLTGGDGADYFGFGYFSASTPLFYQNLMIFGGRGADYLQGGHGARLHFDGGEGIDAAEIDATGIAAPQHITVDYNTGSSFALSDGSSFNRVEILYIYTGSGNDVVNFVDPFAGR